MQRDTDLAFKDIHGTPEAMLVNIEEILHPPTVTLVDPSEALDLRFLQVDDANLDDEYPLLTLTDRGQNIGETNYVAVSYTWQKFDPITNSGSISRYRVLSQGLVRNARSQDAVLHRAIQFARSVGTHFIWIDQDCINQEDRHDLERHLHSVHIIFYQSLHAIGLLSFRIFHQYQIDLIRYIHQGTCLEEIERTANDSTFDGIEVARKLAKALRLFTAISTDKWFGRTWTFMETLAAPHMRLLLPYETVPRSTGVMPVPKPIPISDLELNLRQLYRTRTIFDQAHGQFSTQVGTSSSIHSGYYHQLVGILNQFSRLLSSKYLAEFNTPPWTQKLTLRNVAHVFSRIEQLENTVLSDRILILGYLCGFSWRFETTRLNHYQYSYSTCVFMLLLMNGLISRDKKKENASFLWNNTLHETLEYNAGRLQAEENPQWVYCRASLHLKGDYEEVSGELLDTAFKLCDELHMSSRV